MTLSLTKHKRKNGSVYYDLWDQKRVRGQVVRTYVGYVGSTPHSKVEVSPEALLTHVRRLLNVGITLADIDDVFRKLGLGTPPTVRTLTRVIIENDLKLQKLFLRVK